MRASCDHEGLSPLIPLLFALISGDMSDAARALARSVAAAVAHEPASLTVKNMSSLSAADAAEIRRVLEPELRVAEQPAVEVQVTISENLTQFLLVAEVRRGGERQVLMESWPRTSGVANGAQGKAPRVTLERKLLWEQDLPILDAAQVGDALLVLDAARVTLVRGRQTQSAPIPATHAWPRDMRGRLATGSAAFTAHLPGTICRGATEPQLSLECQDSSEPWLLGPGAIARFAADRNMFQGHIDIEPGGARDLPAFYSAAPANDGWMFAAADGRVHLYSRAWEATSAIDRWGSDIASIQTPCGARILATRATSFGDSDAVQAYDVGSGAPDAAGAAVDFPGPITALWSSGNSATAVSRDPQTGRYAAFSLAPTCVN